MPLVPDASLMSFRRLIRDPLYGYLPITRLENKIIDTCAFQRLDRVSQMHSVHLIYPNAKYSRKCHSLGTMYLVHRAAAALLFRQAGDLKEAVRPLFFAESIEDFHSEALDDLGLNKLKELVGEDLAGLEELLQAMRLAGLLHDIGHAPFSHLFESACRQLHEEDPDFPSFDHEIMSRRIIREVFPKEVEGFTPAMADLVCRILKGPPSEGEPDPNGGDNGDPAQKPLHGKLGFLHQLISGPVDCDKMDYLVRDSHHAGTTEFGLVDTQRLLHGYVVKNGKLLVLSNHLSALKGFFDSYFNMYSAVYYHKACRRFDLTLRDLLTARPSLLREVASTDVENFLRYDDASFNEALRNREGEGQKKARKISDALYSRSKRYRLVARSMLRFPVAITLNKEKHVTKQRERMKREVSTKHDGKPLVIDFDHNVRSIGMRPREIEQWLDEQFVFDTNSHAACFLHDVRPGWRAQLSQMQSPVNVFYRFGDGAAERENALEGDSFDDLRSRVKMWLDSELSNITKVVDPHS